MKRGYQYGFSAKGRAMYDTRARERKAQTMIAVLSNHFGPRLNELSLLNIGGSAGIIDNYLADYFASVVGVDIDAPAIDHAQRTYIKRNLCFLVGDALNLGFAPLTFDVVICSQVYEHVADPKQMMDEIFKVLKPKGICYFAVNNRLMLNEPHYNLPFLSMLPRAIAHLYIKASGKADFYYEKHLSYWGLRKLVERFTVHDYTLKIIQDPQAYSTDYMIKPGSIKASIATLVAQYFHWLSPGYIWLLEKPGVQRHQRAATT